MCHLNGHPDCLPAMQWLRVDHEMMYVLTAGLVLGVMGQGPSCKGSFVEKTAALIWSIHCRC